MKDNKFVDGLIAKRPHEKAPEFVKCTLSIKREELIKWLLGQTGEWINVDVKESNKPPYKWYAAVNEWKKEAPRSEAPAFSGEDLGLGYGGEIPF